MAVQFHTEGLRQPMLIGKDPAGKKLPGGPYVVWQAAGLLVAPLMWNTADWWAIGFGPLSRVMLIVAATAGAFWALGRLDFAGRNPVWALTGLLGALHHSATGAGRLRGRGTTRRPTVHNGAQAPAVIIGAPAPTTDPDPDGAARARPQTAAVVSDSAPASDTTAEPITTGPAPSRRRSPLEAFLAAADSTRPHTGKSST